MTGCGYKGKYIKRINRKREGGVKKRLEETPFKAFGRFDVISISMLILLPNVLEPYTRAFNKNCSSQIITN